MGTSRQDGDYHVTGALSCGSMAIPSGTVTDDDVAAATGIAASKLEHQFVKHYSQESDTKSVDDKHTIHSVYGATGTIQGFEAGTTTLCAGASTITVDLVNNRAGTTATVMSADITLDSGNTVYVPETGTVGTASVVDDDVLEVQIVCTDDGTNAVGNGVFASMILREDAD